MADKVQNRMARGWLLTRKGLAQRLRPCPPEDRRRVFVAGMQRSGTNMLMDVLERSSDTDVYHERDPRAFDNYQMRERPVIQRLVDASKACVFVIKALCELQDLTELMATFAPAKTIWLVRDYNDVVNSMLRSFEGMAQQVQDIARDRNASAWRGRGMSDATHEKVKELAGPDITDATASALQWWFRNMLYFEQGFDRDDRVLTVSYERLVTDPQREFARIFGFIGLPYTPFVSRKVSARSIGKNRQPEVDPRARALCDECYGRFGDITSVLADVDAGKAASRAHVARAVGGSES